MSLRVSQRSNKLLLFRTAVLLLFVLILSAESLADVRRPFTTRYTTNAHGDIYIVGNVSITADPADPNAAAAQAGGNFNNNAFNMVHVDIDTNGTTFNSSNASFFLPAGSSVLWAGLYWGADIQNADGGVVAPPGGFFPANTLLGQVKFSTGGGYQTINSEIPLDFNAGNYRYQGFAEVTNLIRNQFPGTSRTYTLANLQAATGTGPSHYAGWSLVVAVENPSDPLRHFNIFDGFAQVDPATPNVTTTVSGFLTPLSGAFDTHVGMVAYEGDLATSGDFFQINTTSISDALNPVNNFFNSSITRFGTRISAKNPDYVNQLGFDIDVANYTCDPAFPPCLISNGDTTANLTFGMTGDWYYPGVLTFAIDIHDPVLEGQVVKSYIDLNGGGINPGDIIEFQIQITNIGDELATNVVLTDPIPPNTTYVPGSMEIIAGPNLGVKTDASGDDQAEYNAAAGPNGEVTIRLGTGANATTGGIIGIPGSPDNMTTARFQVTIDGGTPDGTPISNAATVDFEDPTGGLFSVTSNIATTVTGIEVDIDINKTVDTPLTFEGNTVTFTITATNSGPDQANNIKITDILPNGFLFSSATPSQGTYSVGSGIWSAGSLASGASATLTIMAVADVGSALLPQPIINTASLTSVDEPDTDSGNNSDTAAVTVSTTSSYSNKYLYLYTSFVPHRMSRTVSAGEPRVLLTPGAPRTWTLTPALTGNLTLPANSFIIFSIWMDNRNSFATFPRAINMRLDSIGATAMAIGNVNGFTAANSNWNLITLFFNIGPADITLLAGSQLVMTITNNAGPNQNISIDPDNAGTSSTVGMVASTLISVDSVEAYNAAYPGGIIPGSFIPGSTVFVRTVVSDPFGDYDITAARVTILDSIPAAVVNNAPMVQVATNPALGTRTYEYQYVIPAGAELGDWSIQVDADEGTEGIVSDTGFGSFTVGLPDLLVRKTVSVIEDPVLGTTNPKAIPGGHIRYDIKIDNEGEAPVDANTVTITDPIPANTELFVGDFDGSGNAVEFIDGLAYGQRTSGLALGLIEYDDGGGFGYVPMPDADGFDPNIIAVRINFTGVFDGNPNNSPSFTAGFKVRIK